MDNEQPQSSTTPPIPSEIVQRGRFKSPFLNTRQAGAYVGLSGRTLEKMRCHGGGPEYRKHGRYVRYHIEALDAWSVSHSQHSTADM
ncbi:MAG TPA: helix-turn-helix domain-containing protein [Rhizomicrobium sp.]|jgi:hypothetical protein